MIELPGGLLIFDADEAVLVGQFVLAGETKLRATYVGGGLPVPPECDALPAYFRGRIEQRQREVPPRAADVPRVTSWDTGGSAEVPAVDQGGSATAVSSWPPTEAAARQLGISARAVRKAIQEGRLYAVRGREGGYRVRPEDLAEYQEARDARAARRAAA